MAPNGTQIGYQHIASMDVSCSGGAFWYYKSFAVRDCSGSPQQPSTSYPAFCANPSGEVVWTAGGNAWQTIGMCIAAYTLIVEPYSCY